MKKVAEDFGFDFPYLIDETQDIARAYGAVCTPDCFGYNADLKLQYRGRLDASRKEAADPGVRRDLFEAMKRVAETGGGPAVANPQHGLFDQMERVKPSFDNLADLILLLQDKSGLFIN